MSYIVGSKPEKKKIAWEPQAENKDRFTINSFCLLKKSKYTLWYIPKFFFLECSFLRSVLEDLPVIKVVIAHSRKWGVGEYVQLKMWLCGRVFA